MRSRNCETQLLQLMADMPFLDRLDMVAVSGWSRGGVYEAMQRLDSEGYCFSILHAVDPLPVSRRFILSPKGLEKLASERGISLQELVRLHPVSTQWRSSLLQRIDSLSVIYRLASTVSTAIYPIRFRWYRSLPLDAALCLPNGRTVGILRQGLTADRTGFSKRLWRLSKGQRLDAVLILTSDEIRLRHTSRLFTRFPVSMVNAFLALQDLAATAGAGDPIWHPTQINSPVDLRAVLAGPVRDLALPFDPVHRKADVPGQLVYQNRASEVLDEMLPALLKPTEKRALQSVFDWPWISRKGLAGLLDISGSRVAQLVNTLIRFGLLICSKDWDGRLVLTDRGLALLARRDRTSLAEAKKRWSVTPIDPQRSTGWRNISGGRSRELLRNIDHTDAVHHFVSALSSQARLLGWTITQLDPPFRASRYFRHQDQLRSINPDAFGILKKGTRVWPFFLEWERRAVRPSTILERLAPYLRYYSSQRPIDDHGVRPAVLVVVEQPDVQFQFLRLAREKMQQARARLPLWVSHRQAIDALGPLGALGDRLQTLRRPEAFLHDRRRIHLMKGVTNPRNEPAEGGQHHDSRRCQRSQGKPET